MKSNFSYTSNDFFIILSTFWKRVLELLSDILKVKIIDKYDQKNYKFVSVCQTQIKFLINNINKQIKWL